MLLLFKQESLNLSLRIIELVNAEEGHLAFTAKEWDTTRRLVRKEIQAHSSVQEVVAQN